MSKLEKAKKIAEMLKRDSERYGIPIKVKEEKSNKKK